MKQRDRKLDGFTYRIQTPVGTAFITVNDNGDKEPFEVFINIGKSGSSTTSLAEALGRMISLVLRMEDGLNNKEKAIEVIGQLKDIGSVGIADVSEYSTYSLPDAVAQAIARHINIWSGEDGQERLFKE